jgi:LAO/AO transport system kinase
MTDLVQRLLGDDAQALARAISLVEDHSARAPEILKAAYPHTGRATVVGVTGAPGSGKSTLVDRLVASYRQDGRRIGVVAVDPSSAFSGGAILGDRVRMQGHALDPGVFIRSMATRGHLGGLSRATNDAIDLLDAAGYDPVLVETVGVGQDEVEIVRTADVVAVVLVPGMGDDIQAIKAGILEIADLFVINKSDREGADRLEADLQGALALAPGQRRPRIYRTVAVRDEGTAELRRGIDEALAAGRAQAPDARRRERAQSRFLALLGEEILERVTTTVLPGRALDDLVSRIAERHIDPYSAAQGVLARVEVR